MQHDHPQARYSAHLAFKRADIEFNEFEKHIFHYIHLADKIVRVNNYWEYSLSEASAGLPETR